MNERTMDAQQPLSLSAENMPEPDMPGTECSYYAHLALHSLLWMIQRRDGHAPRPEEEIAYRALRALLIEGLKAPLRQEVDGLLPATIEAASPAAWELAFAVNIHPALENITIAWTMYMHCEGLDGGPAACWETELLCDYAWCRHPFVKGIKMPDGQPVPPSEDDRACERRRQQGLCVPIEGYATSGTAEGISPTLDLPRFRVSVLAKAVREWRQAEGLPGQEPRRAYLSPEYRADLALYQAIKAEDMGRNQEDVAVEAQLRDPDNSYRHTAARVKAAYAKAGVEWVRGRRRTQDDP